MNEDKQEEPENNRSCSTCKFLVKIQSGFFTDLLGECRRYPEATMVTKPHWCGEHQQCS